MFTLWFKKQLNGYIDFTYIENNEKNISLLICILVPPPQLWPDHNHGDTIVYKVKMHSLKW